MALRRLFVTPRARRDIEEIGRYLREQSGAARARLVLHRILTTCQLFTSQPAAGRSEPDFGPDVRSLVVNPYLVVYRPRGRSIEILRVIHGARDRDAAWHEPSNGGDPPADI